jgi:aspartate-semialdehyde dehydrogenase
MNKLPVAVLGATGMVGQRLISLLAEHPWFQVFALAASDNSVGKKYGDVVRWQLPVEIPEMARRLTVLPCDPAQVQAPLVFSALPSDVAGPLEVDFARAGAIISSNASPHRMEEDVPLVIPEVNAAHLDLIARQRARRNWKGCIICNGNCSTIHLVLALKPLHDRFGLRRVVVTTMQALSGAGYPGVASLDIIDNVIPYIGGEEDKLETEPLKMMGQLDEGHFEMADIKISAQCNRVATRDGHMEAVSVEFIDKPRLQDIVTAFDEFRGAPQELNLPMAPARPVVYRAEMDRPQVKLDRDTDKGMATVVGRLRECKVLDYKFILLGHNTLRGAAGATLLNAELMMARGMLGQNGNFKAPEYETVGGGGVG